MADLTGVGDPADGTVDHANGRGGPAGSPADGRCRAYVEHGSIRLARGAGRRHRRCKRRATVTRTIMRVSLAWKADEQIGLCAQHARLHDKGRANVTGSDW